MYEIFFKSEPPRAPNSFSKAAFSENTFSWEKLFGNNFKFDLKVYKKKYKFLNGIKNIQNRFFSL